MKYIILIFAIFTAGNAIAEDKLVRAFHYYNGGSYLVSKFHVHWNEDNGSTKSKSFEKRVVKEGQGTCFSLDNIGVPENADVWLLMTIQGGDSIKCHNKGGVTFRYSSTSKDYQIFKTLGSTKLYNRCKLENNIPKWANDQTKKSC